MRIDASSKLNFLRENISELAVSAQPLWHPLGFTSCVIQDIPNVLKARIHYWPKNERRVKNPNWPIHTHVYELSSLILHGCVRDIQYDLLEGEEHKVYSVSYSGENSAIEQTDRRLSISSSVDSVRSIGDEYHVPAGVFHQSVVPREKTAITLVVLSNFSDCKPEVLGNDGDQSYPYERKPYDRSIFWDQVNKALELYPK